MPRTPGKIFYNCSFNAFFGEEFYWCFAPDFPLYGAKSTPPPAFRRIWIPSPSTPGWLLHHALPAWPRMTDVLHYGRGVIGPRCLPCTHPPCQRANVHPCPSQHLNAASPSHSFQAGLPPPRRCLPAAEGLEDSATYWRRVEGMVADRRGALAMADTADAQGGGRAAGRPNHLGRWPPSTHPTPLLAPPSG